MSANYNQADSAMAKYEELQNRYNDLDYQLSQNIEKYKHEAENLTGEKGLKAAQETGAQLAQKTAGQAATQAQTAARQAGMSKAAAAMMGSQQAANAYANAYNNAVNQAYSANQDRLGSIQQQSGMTQQQVGNIDTRTGQRMSEAQMHTQRAQADADRQAQIAGSALQTAGSLAMMSDERLKHIFEKCDSDKVINLLKKINAIDFKYTDEAQAEHHDEFNVDNDEHIGVTAQELEKNPLTESTVSEVNGDKVINTAELTMVNTATISSLAKEIAELKDMVWKMQYKHDDEHNEPRKEMEHYEHDDDLIKATYITNGE